MRRLAALLLVALFLEACGSRTGPLGAAPDESGSAARDGGQGGPEAGAGDSGAPPAGDASSDTTACNGTVCGGSCVDLSTDPANCGACNHDCLGGACVTGQCQPVQLAKGQPFSFVAVNSTTVFAGWFGGIISIALPTGAPATLVNQPVRGVVANDPDVFWVAPTGLWVAREGASSQIRRLVAEDYLTQHWAAGIALDASRVYWFSVNGVTLRAVGLDGSAPLSLASPSGDFLISLAADGQAVYWTAYLLVGRTAVPTGTAQELAPITNGLTDIFDDGLEAIDDSNVFVATTDEIVRVPKTGGALALFAPSPHPTAVAVDDTYVYWAEGATQTPPTSTVMRARKSGGQPEVLATAQPNTQHIVVDAVSVIWCNSGLDPAGTDGNVMRLAK